MGKDQDYDFIPDDLEEKQDYAGVIKEVPRPTRTLAFQDFIPSEASLRTRYREAYQEPKKVETRVVEPRLPGGKDFVSREEAEEIKARLDRMVKQREQDHDEDEEELFKAETVRKMREVLQNESANPKDREAAKNYLKTKEANSVKKLLKRMKEFNFS